MRQSIHLHYKKRIIMFIKSIAITFLALLITSPAVSDGHGKSKAAADPLMGLQPTANEDAAAAYYQAVNKNVYNGAIPTKEAQLAAISASVAMKCVYCIPAHTNMAKAAGATDEEIKTAVAIAADVALKSALLYGNQYDMDAFMQIFPQ